MISLLIVGLAVYLLKKGSEFLNETDKLSKDLKSLIQQSRFSNELIRAYEIMNFYSQFLTEDYNPYKKENLIYCSKIALNNEKIKKIFKQNKTMEITKTDKTSLKDLLNNLLRRFENLKLNDIEGYYYKVYSEIEDNIEEIDNIKIIDNNQ